MHVLKRVEQALVHEVVFIYGHFWAQLRSKCKKF